MVDYAIITNVQRGSLHDGPGIRTTFFFQGCNLRCTWCHNPETIPIRPCLMKYPDRCVSCGSCRDICKENGICISCGKCAESCPAEAKVMSGKKMTLDEMLSIVELERPFYLDTGGVTCSGGEPMHQAAFVERFFRELKKLGVKTALDTAANIPWESYEKLLDCTDLFLVDYKMFDDEKHKKYTGVSRKLISQNLKNFVRCGCEVWIRMPIIPGVNDSKKDISDAANELKEIGFSGLVEPLAFHRLGEGKYRALGKKYDFADTVPPSDEKMQEIRNILSAHNLKVK